MSDPIAHVSRRQFCAGACQVASCGALATLASAYSGGSPSPTSPTSPNSPTSPGGGMVMLAVLAGQFTGSGVQVAAAGSPLVSIGGVALVESTAGLFLLERTGTDTFRAIEAVCTHEGCTITGAEGDDYVCPCHGSRYSRNGQVLAGPATASLRQYATSFTDGVVTIAF